MRWVKNQLHFHPFLLLSSRVSLLPLSFSLSRLFWRPHHLCKWASSQDGEKDEKTDERISSEGRRKKLIVAFIAGDFSPAFTIFSLDCLYLPDHWYTLNNSCECECVSVWLREYKKILREKMSPAIYSARCEREIAKLLHTGRHTLLFSVCWSLLSASWMCYANKKKKSRITRAKYNLLLRRVNWNQLTSRYISHACVTVKTVCLLPSQFRFFIPSHSSSFLWVSGINISHIDQFTRGHGTRPIETLPSLLSLHVSLCVH